MSTKIELDNYDLRVILGMTSMRIGVLQDRILEGGYTKDSEPFKNITRELQMLHQLKNKLVGIMGLDE